MLIAKNCPTGTKQRASCHLPDPLEESLFHSPGSAPERFGFGFVLAYWCVCVCVCVCVLSLSLLPHPSFLVIVPSVGSGDNLPLR